MRLSSFSSSFDYMMGRIHQLFPSHSPLLVVIGSVVMAFTQPVYGGHSIDTTKGEAPLSSFAPIVKKVMPAVVNIAVSYNRLYVHPFFADPFFRAFFGNNVPAERVQEQAIGSGTIVRKDGIILTCAHVVKDADKIKVNLRDGRSFEANIIFLNESEDIAILKLHHLPPTETLPIVEMGIPGERSEGDWAIAIGYPEGSSLVTAGIIASSEALLNQHRIMKVTADLGPGMSGGGVFDATGKLIAVPNAILAKLSTLTKHGFAIPIAIPLKYLKSLDAEGRIKQPWHGLTVRTVQGKMAGGQGPLTSTLRNTPDHNSGPHTSEGVVVVSLHPKSPAALAGVKVGDRIVKVGEKIIRNQSDFNTCLASLGIGETVALTLITPAGEKNLSYTIIEAPVEALPSHHRAVTLKKGLLAGVVIAPHDDTSASLMDDVSPAMNGPKPHGVRIVSVPANSPAEGSLGLRKGDIIEKINGKSVNTPQDVVDIPLQNTIELSINRNGISLHTSLSMMGG